MHQNAIEAEAVGRRTGLVTPVYVFDIFGTLHQVAMTTPGGPAVEPAPRAGWWRLARPI